MKLYLFFLAVFVGLILYLGRDFQTQDMITGLLLFVALPFGLGVGVGRNSNRSKGGFSADEN